MGSIVRHFYTSGDDTIRVLTRFEDDEGLVGRTDERVTSADRYFGIPYDQLAAAGSGQVIVAKDGTATIRHVDDQRGEAETGS